MYRLRFYNGRLNQYGVIYLDSDGDIASVKEAFDSCAREWFQIRHVTKKSSFVKTEI